MYWTGDPTWREFQERLRRYPADAVVAFWLGAAAVFGLLFWGGVIYVGGVLCHAW